MTSPNSTNPQIAQIPKSSSNTYLATSTQAKGSRTLGTLKASLLQCHAQHMQISLLPPLNFSDSSE